MGLKQWDPAMKSFETCYSKYKNGPGDLLTQQGDKGNRRPNIFRMHSLVQWANIRMSLEDFPEARDLYKKVLKEDQANRLPALWKIYIGVNLGRSLIKAGDIDEGYKYIIRVLDQENFPDSLKQTVFAILADDWSVEVNSPRTLKFLDDYDHISVSASAETRMKRNDNIFFLANQALDNEDPILALRWLRLIANPGATIIENSLTKSIYETRLKAESAAEVKTKISEEIERLAKANNKLRKRQWEMMSTAGKAHFVLKNYSASYAVYSELSDQAKEHKDRPVFLHNAVVSAVHVDDWRKAYKYGKIFLDEFPEHELKPGVVRFLVEIVFLNGNYQEAYDIGREVRVDMDVGSDMRDIPDFVVGASAFQLNDFGEANRELTAYLKNYPKAKRKELARYFLGSARVKLFLWQGATEMFDPFLSEYPGSAMTASVLYQNGLCKFMLDDNASAKSLVERLLKEFPHAEEIPTGWNLRGDIASVEEESYEDVIRPAYLKGKETSAKYPGQEEVAAYSLWQLLMNSGSAESWDESEGYFDEFQKEHPNSAYKVEVLIGALPTLVETGRTEEAEKRLVDLLYSTGGDPQTGGLSELFGTYLEFIEDYYPFEKVQELLDELAISSRSSVTLRNWAMLGKIQVMEKAEGDFRDGINTLFHRINNEFDPAENSNYVIVRLARWHSVERKQPQAAEPLYDFILENRQGTDDYDFALLDRAEIDAKSKDPEARKRAMKNFDRVLNQFGNAELAETASIGIARLLTEDEKFEEALKRWENYMDNPTWSRHAAEANYQYGNCLDKLDRTKEALVVYVNTYNAFPGHVEYSTPAWIRSAMIMKEKGEDLKALLILKDMLTRLKKIDHPNKKKALDLFVKWRDEYVPESK